MTSAIARASALALRRSVSFFAGFLATEIPVLTYHSVDQSGSLLSVSPALLRGHLAWLRSEGWRGLSIAEYTAAVHARAVNQRTLLITFDDGYRNFREHAVPLLEEFGFKATLFIPVDFVGRQPLWLERDRSLTRRLLDHVGLTPDERRVLERNMALMRGEPLMDWPELDTLARAGVDIQSHGASHSFLTTLSPALLADDLSRSRKLLQERFGHPMDAIAYPYGDCNGAVARAAREAGYTVGFVSDHGPRDRAHMMCWRAGVSGRTTTADMRSILMSWPFYPRMRRLLGRGPAPLPTVTTAPPLSDQPKAATPGRLR